MKNGPASVCRFVSSSYDSFDGNKRSPSWARCGCRLPRLCFSAEYPDQWRACIGLAGRSSSQPPPVYSVAVCSSDRREREATRSPPVRRLLRQRQQQQQQQQQHQQQQRTDGPPVAAATASATRPHLSLLAAAVLRGPSAHVFFFFSGNHRIPPLASSFFGIFCVSRFTSQLVVLARNGKTRWLRGETRNRHENAKTTTPVRRLPAK